MSKFYPKAAHFESKSIIAPNVLIFHRLMSDATKLLILALHAISTCAPSWTVVQSDVQKRMGWGRDKMNGAIKEAVQFGYLKVTQARKEEEKDKDGNPIKGQFASNSFEFDILGGYLSYAAFMPQEETADNGCEPSTENPLTENPSTENQPLPSSMSSPISKKEPLSAPMGIVVPSSLDKIEIDYSLKLKISNEYTPEEIEKAVERCLLWKGRPSDDVGVMTALRKADTWIDNLTKDQKTEIEQDFLKSLKHLDTQRIANTNITVGTTYIEFTSGMKVVVYNIGDPEFKKNVKDYLVYLNKKDKEIRNT